MRQITEVLRLAAQGLSCRQIGQSVGISASTVQGYLERARHAGISWPLPEDVDDAALEDRSQRINFNTVAAAAGVAKTYLYKEPALRDQIDLLREQRDEVRRHLAPLRERTEASARLLVAAKDRSIRELQARVKQLEGELAACRGELYERL